MENRRARDDTPSGEFPPSARNRGLGRKPRKMVEDRREVTEVFTVGVVVVIMFIPGGSGYAEQVRESSEPSSPCTWTMNRGRWPRAAHKASQLQV